MSGAWLWAAVLVQGAAIGLVTRAAVERAARWWALRRARRHRRGQVRVELVARFVAGGAVARVRRWGFDVPAGTDLELEMSVGGHPFARGCTCTPGGVGAGEACGAAKGVDACVCACHRAAEASGGPRAS